MKPAREHTTNNVQTYFVTAKTWESRALFRAEPWARLFFQNLLSHRESYFLHEFVLMPDHFHLLITPLLALERAVQLIKGGFSYRAKRELGSNAEIWQRGFADHRIRDAEDYDRHVHYIRLNPVKKRLCDAPSTYHCSSAFPGWKLDPIPQGLKPADFVEVSVGTAKAVPFQNEVSVDTAEVVPLQNEVSVGTAKAVPFQNEASAGKAEVVAFQNEVSVDTADVVPFQNEVSIGAADVVPFQNEVSIGAADVVPFQNRSGGER